VNALITESLKRGSAEYIFALPEQLTTKTEKKWLKFIAEYMAAYGVLPTVTRMSSEFSDFVEENCPDPLGDIYAVLLQEKKNFYTRSFIEKNLESLRSGADPTNIILELSKTLSAGEVSAVDTSNFDKEDYYSTPSMLETNIEVLDSATGGIADGDLVFIVGRPADGKTTLLLHMIARWYWEGKKILCVSNEIPYLDMLFKVDSILAGVPVGEKRTGKFSDESKAKLSFLRYLQAHSPGKIIMPKHPVRRPAEVQALIKQHKPDVVAIDGAYLMSTDGTATAEWAVLASVSRELKQIANVDEIPIVGVLQANRTAEEKQSVHGGGIAGTDAFFQDADIILAVRSLQTTESGKGKHVLLSTTKNRHGPHITAELAYDFVEMTMREL
jgi:predicted ATP-dependent serine protease